MSKPKDNDEIRVVKVKRVDVGTTDWAAIAAVPQPTIIVLTDESTAAVVD